MLPALDSWLPQALSAPFVSVSDFFDAGGPVLKLIFIAAVVMWTLIIERYWYFLKIFPVERAALQRSWQLRSDHRSWCARRIRTMLISQANVAMGSTLPIMRVVIPMCPLLGLLGTVSGMLEVFDMMTLHGSVDAQTMASGVSHAMVSTLSGLAVALSGMFFVHYFQTRVQHETEMLNDILSNETRPVTAT
ncbi:MAG TPA: MotA/TolQ/ExbB proton channel family protein [Stenotrophobium sp.]|nr:MotA/TolQ/ExbB proton channel family protein [Stenotrophobium sp.]